MPLTNWDALSKWGTKKYKFTRVSPQGQKVETGTVILETKLGPKGITLADKFLIEVEGKKVSMDMTQICRRDQYLSPLHIVCKGEGDDEFKTFQATFKDGKAHVRGERDQVMKIPEGTVTFFAFFRIVTQLPRREGAAYAFNHSLEAHELNLKEGYRIRVIGKETIICDGVSVKCWKISQEGGDVREILYWITDEGVLQRVLFDARKQMDLQIGD